MNPKMSKRAFTSFKAKSKPKKWTLERGRKVTWKKQRAQDARSKMLARIPEEHVPYTPKEPEKA